MFLYSLAVFAFFLSVAQADTLNGGSSVWSGWGGNIFNNRWASKNTDITSSNIKTLSDHCPPIGFLGGFSATPTIYESVAYFPSWNGSYLAYDYISCKLIWQLNVTDIIASSGPITTYQSTVAVARTSAQIDGDVLYFGTLAHALMVAVNRNTGQVLSTITLNPHELAIVTMSPTFYNNKIFVGVSSFEEGIAMIPGYKCCSFIGNILALSFDKSASKFKILWNIPTIPAEQAASGWAGVGVWGSQPSIDIQRNQVFFATGNTYAIPQVIIDCQTEAAKIPAVAQGLVPDPCLPSDILQETILAIDIDLGVPNWIHQLPALDAWTVACGIPGVFPRNNTQCPQTPGPDADFGMAPTFVPGSANTPYGKDTIITGQKNGIVHAVSAQAGQEFWSTATSPGSATGGLSWGLAVDDKKVYFTAINGLGDNWTLQPSGGTVTNSGWGAVSLIDGSFVWEVATPNGGQAFGPPSVVGDLVLVGRTVDAGTTNTTGSFLALQKSSGSILFKTDLTPNFRGGMAVQGSSVLFGTGYGGISGLSDFIGDFYIKKVGS